jgi:hypothetical protein
LNGYQFPREIAGFGVQKSTGDVHAFLATPRNGEDGGQRRATPRLRMVKIVPIKSKTRPKRCRKRKALPLQAVSTRRRAGNVLVDDRTLNPVASLKAGGFETEGFAKHVGHKVTVRGTSNPGGAVPVFKVRSIETVSDACVPQPQ